VFGIALLLIYWTAHMAFPYIDSHVNLIIDFHIVFAALTAWLVAVNAGRVYGLDGWLAQYQLSRRTATASAVAMR
jgi:thiosulfate dehydrogenase [quinone] large subunit